MRRRRFLEAVPAIGAVGFAGCTGSSGGGSPPTATTSGGERTTTGQRDPVSIDGAPYSVWLPEPGTFEPAHHYGFSAVNLQEVAEREESLPGGLEKSPHVSGWQPVDIDWRSVTLSLFFQRNFVIRGDYDAGPVTEKITSMEGWSSESAPGGGRALVKEDGSKAVGVSEEAIVISPAFGPEDDVIENVQRIVDTVGGTRVRYIGASDVMYDLVAELRDGTIVSARTMEEIQVGDVSTGRFPGQVGRGRWGQYRGDATDVKFVVAYASKSKVEVNDLETFVEKNSDRFGKWTGLEISQNGRLAIISGTMG